MAASASNSACERASLGGHGNELCGVGNAVKYKNELPGHIRLRQLGMILIDRPLQDRSKSAAADFDGERERAGQSGKA
jgi:hypothetical protein